jgi:hypothetical protein
VFQWQKDWLTLTIVSLALFFLVTRYDKTLHFIGDRAFVVCKYKSQSFGARTIFFLFIGRSTDSFALLLPRRLRVVV